LLAIGLAGGGIAFAVNILANQVSGAGWLGFLAPIILIVGHGFNFVLGIVVSFIQSMRLHFVEFFSLFFGEGGQKFEPFKIKQSEGYIWKQ